MVVLRKPFIVFGFSPGLRLVLSSMNRTCELWLPIPATGVAFYGSLLPPGDAAELCLDGERTGSNVAGRPM
jgi:hypothetical protein